MGIGRLARLLSLVLLPALAAETASAGPHAFLDLLSRRKNHAGSDKGSDASTPYLRNSLALNLRFSEASVPPPYDMEPVPTGPASLSDGSPPPPVARSRLEPTAEQLASKNEPPKLDPRKPQEEEPAAILPDDLRREVRPEDVIPFFQFPQEGTSGVTLGVSVPVPPQAAAPQNQQSTATYTQH